MVSTPMSWAGVAMFVVGVALALLLTPWFWLLALVGLGLVWAAPHQAGTVSSYTYHGAGHDDFGGRGANDSRRGL
jgi:hypothetical protein